MNRHIVNFPINPDCPDVIEFEASLLDSPDTSPIGEMMHAYHRDHLAGCARCKSFASENVEAEAV